MTTRVSQFMGGLGIDARNKLTVHANSTVVLGTTGASGTSNLFVGKAVVAGLTFPTSDGSSGQFLKTDGAGALSFSTVDTNLVSDTSPQLGGDLDVNAKNINFGDSATAGSDDTLHFGASQDLRIYPRPTQSNPQNLFIKFSFPANPFKPNLPFEDESVDGVSNLSNVPFGNIQYSKINQMSRQWIRQYTLALSRETLGLVRSKFSSVPIPGSDVQMNGNDLISQGREDRQRLAESLSETLDKLTYQKLLETDAAQSESMMNILKRVPVPNGRAIIIG